MAPMSPAATPISLSPSRRAWLRFKRNRLGYWSLLIFCALVLVSLCAELVSNDKPLIVRYEGHTYFPMLKDTSVLFTRLVATHANGIGSVEKLIES